jgi:DNA topoisomerase-1
MGMTWPKLGTPLDVRMTKSNPGEPGISRRRQGRGFRYLDAQGAPVSDPDELARIKALVIPPAWQRVWICAKPNGHIQAIGYDAAGRRQYLYHERWRRDRDEEKHDRVRRLADRLPALRRAVAGDLECRGPCRQRALAMALRILDSGGLRTGGEEYLSDNGSHGLATIRLEHARIRSGCLELSFPAKSGVHSEISVEDSQVVKAYHALRRAGNPTGRMLAFRGEDGWCEVHSDDINARLKELVGDEFTGKDLRTWHAAVAAAVAFARQPPATSKTAAKRAVAAVMREVADELGNTPAVTRSSYVDPRLVRAYESGHTIVAALRRADKADQSKRQAIIEQAVVKLIDAVS